MVEKRQPFTQGLYVTYENEPFKVLSLLLPFLPSIYNYQILKIHFELKTWSTIESTREPNRLETWVSPPSIGQTSIMGMLPDRQLHGYGVAADLLQFLTVLKHDFSYMYHLTFWKLLLHKQIIILFQLKNFKSETIGRDWKVLNRMEIWKCVYNQSW